MGKYRVIRTIGRGGMGVVVEALHLQLDERVALKFLLPDFTSRPEFAERFVREARAAVKIKGEHVTKVTDVGTLESGAPYMVMELLDGKDLSALLQVQGSFQLHDAVDLVIQACEALAEAHQAGIVHRDIKPANLFLANRSDGSSIVKVLDFGISKLIGGTTDGLTKTTATMGSALYMAPEQMRQAKSVDHRADIYAIGITLYELLAGKQPYLADTLPELCALVLTGVPTPLRDARPDLPPAFAAVLERAYERDRDRRYSSIAELVYALAPFATARVRSNLERVARFGAGSPTTALPSPAMGPGQTQRFPTNAGPIAPVAQPGAGTNASMARSNGPMPPPVPRSSNGAWIALAAVVLVASVVGGLFATGFFRQAMDGAAPAAGSATNSPGTATATAEAALPSAAATQLPSNLPANSPSTVASESASVSAAPELTTKASSAKPGPIKPATSPKPSAKTTSPAPTATQSPPPTKTSPTGNVFDHR